MEPETKPSISYTGVVLDHHSHIRLLVATAGYHIPFGWKTYAHHMTINMGPLNLALNPHIVPGMQINLKVTHVGFDDKVIAAKVECPGIATTNKVPHITVAVNRDGGGKPKHSNDLPEHAWLKLDEEIDLVGFVTEVENPKEVTK